MKRHNVGGMVRGLPSRVANRGKRRAGEQQKVRDELTAVTNETARLRKQIAALETGVQALQDEVQECRHLNRRLAELTDIVQELLLPIAEQDETKIRETLAAYAGDLTAPVVE